MKISQLQEGIIRVPKLMTKQCMSETLKFISTIIIRGSDDPELFKNHLNLDYIPPHVLKDYGVAYDIKADIGQILGITLEYDERIVKYSQKTGTATYLFGAGILGEKAKTLGMYLPKSNAVVVNLYKLWKDLESELSIKTWVGHGEQAEENYQNTPLPERIEILQGVIQPEINRYINDFMSSLDATIEHELAHLIQYRYLRDKHEDQVSDGDYRSDDMPDAAKYYGSQVEFSPQVISAIRGMETYVDDLKHENLDRRYFKFVLRYLVGEIKTAAELTGKLKDANIETPKSGRSHTSLWKNINDNRNFFLALRDNKPKVWRVAVKYLTTEIDKLDLW